YGWKYGFGAAGFGMLLGLIVFVIGKPLLRGNGEPSDPAGLRRRVAGLPVEWLLYGLGLVIVVACGWMVQNQEVVGWALGLTGVAVLLSVGSAAVTRLDADARNRIFAAIILMGGSVLSWALFEQAGSSLHLYTDRYVHRNMLRWEVPASMFPSINSMYI